MKFIITATSPIDDKEVQIMFKDGELFATNLTELSLLLEQGKENDGGVLPNLQYVPYDKKNPLSVYVSCVDYFGTIDKIEGDIIPLK